MSGGTFGLLPGTITASGLTTFSLDTASYWGPGTVGYDGNGATTNNDSFNLVAPSGADSPSAAYSVTFGDNSGSDELYNLILNYGGVTVTQTGGDQLIIDNALSIIAGTLDLGDSAELTFGGASQSFVLDGILQGDGGIDPGGPALTGTGTIISVASVDDSNLSIGIAVDAGVTAQVTSGSQLEFSTIVQSGVQIAVDNPANGAVILDDLAGFSGTIAGLGIGTSASHGSYIDLPEIHPSSIVSSTLVNNIITLTGTVGTLGTIALSGNYSGKYADWSPDAVSGTSVGTEVYLSNTVCFVSGTRILTAGGSVPIEAIHAGAEVIAIVDGQRVSRRVKWIGYRRLELLRHPDRAALAPIRFRQGCMSDGLPERDLLVSPPHCMFIDGKLIPAKLLVNEMTIVKDTTLNLVEYYHLELDRHAVVVAEGVASESYLDTGNRAFFSNAGLALMLHPEFHVNAGLRCWEVDACAPLAVSPAAVLPAWRRFVDRAIGLGYVSPIHATTADADIHLIADGRRLDAISVSGQSHSFIVPAGVTRVELGSRSVVPADLAPYLDDPRQIGVAIRRLVVRGRADTADVAADHPALSQGWHAAEHDQDTVWRWTKGRGILPVRTTTTAVVIDIVISETTTYRIDEDRPKAALAA